MKKYHNETMKNGVSLYLAIVILFILLSIALGVSAILISQMKIIREMGYSVVALYAADTGIENALKVGGAVPETSLENGARYYVQFLSPGAGGCTGQAYCLRSVGIYKGIRRAIEIIR